MKAKMTDPERTNPAPTDPEPTPNPGDRPSQIPWPPILLVGVIAFAVVAGQTWPLPWPGLDDGPARFVGLGLGALGLVLMAWAAYEFGRAKTTIRPDAGATNLITTGPFARFRNPVYLADTLILLGVAELTKNIWFVIGAAAFVPLVTYLAILPEERHLARRFGAAYDAYKARSRRWI